MENNQTYRKELFTHLDGLVLFPTLNGLIETKILDEMIHLNSFTINDISESIVLNKGYLNVALRLLYSTNLIDFNKGDTDETSQYIIKNDLLKLLHSKSEIDFSMKLIPGFINFNSIFNEISKDLLEILNKYLSLLKNYHNDISTLHYEYFKGIILGPILVCLSFNNLIEDYSENKILKIKDIDNKLLKILHELFILCDFIKIDNKNNFIITERGNFFFKRSTSYGVTVSYLPLFNKIKVLLTGNSNFIWERDQNNHEIHINRTMNVWGSGGSHKTYFKKIILIITNIFNKKIDEQPLGIIDVGCGDGTFLKYVYNIITQNTIRKDYLDSHPLFIIGTDINKAARIAARKKLNKQNINNLIINGNISEPTIINKYLRNELNCNLEDLLNTRTFLDHNRIYSKPKYSFYKNISTSGVFAYKGRIIEKHDLINNLIEHFISWQPYIKKHGLILLELHTINPKKTKNILGKTLACAYDATHGYSDQYLVEHDVFEQCLINANLEISKKYLELFPNKLYPTVSINYIK